MIMLLLPDLAEARRFYEGLLGFDVREAGPDRLILHHEGLAFHIYRCEEPAPAVEHGRSASSVLVFGVPDIEAAMAELSEKGIEFLHAVPAANASGRYAAFRAPSGLVHEIFQQST
ncbi:VOC family protein [Phenylobacterium sp.]|uniref:VOC family protein n=1 Tax=Phenylobacterium sp. TaxID=1871053 RepID=UPI002E37BF59|nr:VOC family protein [Phenylobacterium sp.]HEX2559442.1 VOC family protein [Phenylobacterium sp.]